MNIISENRAKKRSHFLFLSNKSFFCSIPKSDSPFYSHVIIFLICNHTTTTEFINKIYFLLHASFAKYLILFLCRYFSFIHNTHTKHSQTNEDSHPKIRLHMKTYHLHLFLSEIETETKTSEEDEEENKTLCL